MKPIDAQFAHRYLLRKHRNCIGIVFYYIPNDILFQCTYQNLDNLSLDVVGNQNVYGLDFIALLKYLITPTT